MAKEKVAGITPEALASLTGTPAVELAKLVRQKFIPAAVGGKYPMTEAITGWFRWHRQTQSESDGFPVYDSMQQCASATGVPLSVLKQSKRSGCDAFKSNRVFIAKFLKWFFATTHDAEDWPKRSKRADALLKELDLERAQDRTVDKAEVAFAIAKGEGLIFAQLDRAANVELPPELKGMSEREIQTRLLAAIEQIKETLRNEWGKWMKDAL